MGGWATVGILPVWKTGVWATAPTDGAAEGGVRRVEDEVLIGVESATAGKGADPPDMLDDHGGDTGAIGDDVPESGEVM